MIQTLEFPSSLPTLFQPDRLWHCRRARSARGENKRPHSQLFNTKLPRLERRYRPMSVMDLRSKITAVNLVTRVRRMRRMWPPGISFDFEQTKEKLQESLKTRFESIREGVEKTIFQKFQCYIFMKGMFSHLEIFSSHPRHPSDTTDILSRARYSTRQLKWFTRWPICIMTLSSSYQLRLEQGNKYWK